jgi:dihydroneopterin aldolase/2-amino-4-hydroxy-6-hydroxymethyldihydropteridine diphosphokinase
MTREGGRRQVGGASDLIRLVGIRGVGHHGVFEHERREGQEFLVDVEIESDFAEAADSDDLASTVDYGAVGEVVLARIEGEPCNLIERLVDLIAADIASLPGVREVSVTVHKPQAPMPVPFADVAVTRRRRGALRAVLGLGANLGDALGALQGALDALAADEQTEVTAVSGVWRTAPVGGPEQPDYLNAVVVIGTTRDPWQLLALCHRIEAHAGRVRTVWWGPRTLDIDILAYDGQRWADPDLSLPHPRAAQRAFVLAPWAEVAAGDRPGGPGTPTVAELLAGIGPNAGVKRLDSSRITLTQ